MKYEVELTRKIWQSCSVVIEAGNMAEAEEIALRNEGKGEYDFMFENKEDYAEAVCMGVCYRK